MSGTGGFKNPTSSPQSSEEQNALSAYGQLPLSFEANQGQVDPSVDFVAHGQGYSLSLSHGHALLGLQPQPAPSGASGALDQTPQDAPEPSTVVGVQLLGAAMQPEAIGQQRLPGTTNYFIGNDPSQWHTNIPTYAQVAYPSVYPGIDLVYHANQGQLESDFVLSPGADPMAIQLVVAGADSLDVDARGSLVVRNAGGEVHLQAPVAYQDAAGVRMPISAAYLLGEEGQVSFTLGAYDASRPLVIDPVLVYSTFMGGSSGNYGSAVAVDGAGNAYVTGDTISADFPTTPGALQTTFRGYHDAVVSKLNASGTALVYSTFLGGSRSASGTGIAVDPAGNAYVTGSTYSSDFPTTPGAFETTFRGFYDDNAFVSKLNASGTALVYSTFLGGGSSGDSGTGITVDGAGNAYVIGSTYSPDFPTTPGAFQTTFRGYSDAFVSKLNASGTALVYSTFLGGSGYDAGHGIAVDGGGNAYLVGSGSADFPTTPDAFQTTFRGYGDAFVSKLNASGTALVYSSFLGGSSYADGGGIALDGAGNAYVTGRTGSADFPTTPGAFQTTFRGSYSDAFVSKLNASGTALVYSSFLGGSSDHGAFGTSIAVDTAGLAYVTGSTYSSDFPTTPGAFQTSFHGYVDAFVTMLNASGTALVYSTFLGGSGNSSGDSGSGIAVDGADNAYVTGSTDSADFPTTPGAFQTSFRGYVDAFVSKIVPAPPTCQIAALPPGPPAQLQVAVQAEEGLASLIVSQASNASVAIPTFTPGTTDTLLVIVTKLDQSTSSTVTLEATDQAGRVTDCDPALVSIGREQGVSRSVTLHHVAHSESQVTIRNGTPGLTELRLHVNGHVFVVDKLRDGQTRTLDVSAAMRKGERNTITVQAVGPRGGSATVLVSDH